VTRLACALVLCLGCAGEQTETLRADTGPPDAGPGPLGGCAPRGAPNALSCPAGCVSLEGGRIDTDRACVTAERLVVACHPDDALVGGDLAFHCYRHGEDASLVVRTPSTRVAVEGVTDDLYVASGWVRCSDEDTGRFVEPCP